MQKKTGKRILEVTIRRMCDDCPDTSMLGEYKDRPDGEFSIDRATETFQGDIDAGMEWLDRIESRLSDEYDQCGENGSQDDVVWFSSLESAIDTIADLKREEPFEASWDNRKYRYFNPSDNYKGLPSEEIRKYTMQDYKRMESLYRGDWCYLGVRADAKIGIGDLKNYPARFDCTLQKITSGGLWGIESDSDRSYFEEVEGEQLADLKTQLLALGFSKRAIATAFKNVQHKDE